MLKWVMVAKVPGRNQAGRQSFWCYYKYPTHLISEFFSVRILQSCAIRFLPLDHPIGENLVCMESHFSFVGLNLGRAEIENNYNMTFSLQGFVLLLLPLVNTFFFSSRLALSWCRLWHELYTAIFNDKRRVTPFFIVSRRPLSYTANINLFRHHSSFSLDSAEWQRILALWL
jgi:hypothetical protein